MRLFALAFVLGAFLLQNQRALPGREGMLLGVAAALACALVPHERRVARGLVVAAAEMAFGKPDRADGMGPAHVRTLEPGEAFAQLRDTLVEPAGFDFPVTEDHPGPRSVARQRFER